MAKNDKQQAESAPKAQATESQVRSEERRGDHEEGGLPGEDHMDPSADTMIYPADVGYSATSHGDGSPTISPQLIARREELAERNANPDQDNEELAQQLGL